jgi:hypothetical protein
MDARNPLGTVSLRTTGADSRTLPCGITGTGRAGGSYLRCESVPEEIYSTVLTQKTSATTRCCFPIRPVGFFSGVCRVLWCVMRRWTSKDEDSRVCNIMPKAEFMSQRSIRLLVSFALLLQNSSYALTRRYSTGAPLFPRTAAAASFYRGAASECVDVRWIDRARGRACCCVCVGVLKENVSSSAVRTHANEWRIESSERGSADWSELRVGCRFSSLAKS